MRSPILDLEYSSTIARETNESFHRRALDKFFRIGVVSTSFLQEAESFPRSLLWPRILLEQEWADSHLSLESEGLLRKFLIEESRAQGNFSYDASKSLLQSLGWKLPAGQDLTDIPSASGQYKVQEALELIAKIWPEGLSNLRELCVGLVWFTSPVFFNFSNITFYGGIFFRPDVLERSPLEIATLMIHEAAHHVLFIDFMRDPLILDDRSKTVYSPLRKTERPIHGVFQSQAALARMILWLHRVMECEDQLGSEVIDEARRFCSRYERDLRAVTEPMSSLRYTPYGERIMRDFKFICEHL